MATSRFLPRALGAFGAVAVATSALPSLACDYGPMEVSPGVLAIETYSNLTVPRNVAFVWQSTPTGATVPNEGVIVAESEAHAHVLAFATSLPPSRNGSYVVRPSEPLPPGAQYYAYQYGTPGSAFTTADYLDEAAPETPRIQSGSITFSDGTQGCAQSSCGDVTSLSFTLERPARDDHTPERDVIYALYLATSAEGARNAEAPYALLTSSYLHLDHEWADRDAFIALAALDYAGNESPRSEPVRVNTASDDGCALRAPRARGSVGWSFLALAGLALLRRLRRTG